MVDKSRTTVQISKSGLGKLNRLASIFRRSATAQIEWMIDRDLMGLDAMGVQQVSEFTHPQDANPFPLVTTRTVKHG